MRLTAYKTILYNFSSVAEVLCNNIKAYWFIDVPHTRTHSTFATVKTGRHKEGRKWFEMCPGAEIDFIALYYPSYNS